MNKHLITSLTFCVFALLAVSVLSSTAKAQTCFICLHDSGGGAICWPPDGPGSTFCDDSDPEFCVILLPPDCTGIEGEQAEAAGPNIAKASAKKTCRAPGQITGSATEVSYTDGEMREISKQSPRFAVMLRALKWKVFEEGKTFVFTWIPMDVTPAYFESRLKPNLPESIELKRALLASRPPLSGINEPSTVVHLTLVNEQLQFQIVSGARSGELEKLSIPVKGRKIK